MFANVSIFIDNIQNTSQSLHTNHTRQLYNHSHSPLISASHLYNDHECFSRLILASFNQSPCALIYRSILCHLNSIITLILRGTACLCLSVQLNYKLGLILLALGSLLVLSYVWYRQQYRSVHSCKCKDPKAWPILGSQLEAARNYERLIDWITDFFDDGHRTVKMSFLSRRSYLTVDPANVEHILKNNFQNYPKGQESHHRLFDLLGNGILNTDGSMWRSHRKLGSLEFSIKKLRHLSSSVYKSHALKLVEVLAKRGQQGDVDMQELLLTMTFHSICEVVFGSKVTKSSSMCEDASIASALDNVQEMITRRYVFPWWRMQRFLNVGSERVLRQEITRFNAFLTNVINQKRLQMQEEAKLLATTSQTTTNLVQDIHNHEGLVEDLLSRFILHHVEDASTHAGLSTRAGCEKRELSMECDDESMMKDVRDAMMSFVMAGRDTTASTLSWLLYCMCTNPDKQDEVFQELLKLENKYYSSHNKVKFEEHVGDLADGRSDKYGNMEEFAEKIMSYEALQNSNTPYLHAALAETLRLYPAVPRDGKVALKDDVLPDGTHIKAGDQVAYIPYAMGRMPFLWGSDALLFKPERWIDNNGSFQTQSPFKFTAFQAGPRMCLGKDAAYLQMKITAALLLRYFRFELVPNHPVKYRMMMVMTMKHGLRVNLIPR